MSFQKQLYYSVYDILSIGKKMSQIFKKLSFKTSNKKFLDITNDIKEEINRFEIIDGLLNLSIMHTSCSLLIQENADPSVLKDIRIFLEQIAPEKKYNHESEGPDDMPAHLKSLLTQTHLSLSIRNRELILGTWQGIFLLEHRLSDRIRHVQLHFISD